MKNKTYSFLKGASKTLIELIIWAGPSVIGLLPNDVANLTLSAVLRLGLNYLKVKWQAGEPITK